MCETVRRMEKMLQRASVRALLAGHAIHTRQTETETEVSAAECHREVTHSLTHARTHHEKRSKKLVSPVSKKRAARESEEI